MKRLQSHPIHSLSERDTEENQIIYMNRMPVFIYRKTLCVVGYHKGKPVIYKYNSHHSRIWHRVNHSGFCFPADINNDTYNFLFVQLTLQCLSIGEMANYLLSLVLCLNQVKHWHLKVQGKSMSPHMNVGITFSRSQANKGLGNRDRHKCREKEQENGFHWKGSEVNASV